MRVCTAILAAGVLAAGADEERNLPMRADNGGNAVERFRRSVGSNSRIVVSGTVYAVIDGETMIVENAAYAGRLVMVVGKDTARVYRNSQVSGLKVYSAGYVQYGVDRWGPIWVHRLCTDPLRARELQRDKPKGD